MALTLWAQLLEAALQLRFLCQFLGGRALPVRSGGGLRAPALQPGFWLGPGLQPGPAWPTSPLTRDKSAAGSWGASV